MISALAIECGKLYPRQERRIRDEAQKAAIRFERANSMHAVAKQQVSLTQDSLNRQNTKTVDAACLEVLNHHVQRVNEAEEERLLSEEEHRRVSQRIIDIAQRIKQFEKEQGRTIKKSRVYFDSRVEFTRVLEQQKALIQRLEAEVRQKKVDYTTSLRNLERISDAIHEERQIAGLKREQGVGCESPDPPPMEISRIEMEPVVPLLTSVLPNSSEQLPYDISAVNLRDRSISDPIDPSLFDNALKPPATESKRPVSLGSGVILLAQQLTGIGTSWLADEEKRRAASKAFTFPPEDVDVRYRTAPEGVKPLPTPPLPEPSDSDSEVCSLASGRGEFTDEELTLRGMLRSHTDLINEIDICAERLKQSMHVRSVSDAERESASGESSAGF
uniref:Uncharacterized protein n=1 Tax=Plectus sambesii TaxID=2011161 RepID=A0A914WN52_9BILA